MSLLGIAALALEAGPAVIRGVSSLFGGSETADNVASMVEKADALLMPKEQKAKFIEAELSQLPPEQLVELEKIKLELEKEITRRQEIAAEDRQAEHSETQTTVRHSDNAGDPWVRRARPVMAMTSLAAGVVYVIAMSILNAFGKGVGPDMGTTASLLALAGTFMGLRHVEKNKGIAS